MGYQKIAGIKVTPVGAQGPQGPTQGPRIRNAPFNHATAAPVSGRAFGGWIYGGNLQMGFAESPTTLSLDIALDTQTDGGTLNNASAGIGFDIRSGDLKINHIPGNAEGYYKINVGSTEFGPMYLTSYEVNASAESKTLKVEFTDYSAILDKIYVGLFKREGYNKTHARKLLVNPSLDAFCSDCSLTNAKQWHVRGTVSGTIETAAYFINHYNAAGRDILGVTPNVNENYKDYFRRRMVTTPPWNFAQSTVYNNFFPANPYLPAATDSTAANINGGTLIIGTEEFNENKCGELSNVSYNFSELLHALAQLKIKFTQANSSAFPTAWTTHISGKLDKNPNYRRSYNGTLREVLNEWCADFGLNFYMDGKKICFIDTSAGVNLGDLPNAMIPRNNLGQAFNSDKNNAIGSYSEKFDLKDTYGQAIVTANVKPREVEDIEKTIKNACGFLATHPLDWLYYNSSVFAGHSTMFGQQFNSERFLNRYALVNWLGTNTTNANSTATFAGSNNFFTPVYNTLANSPFKHYWYTNRAVCVIDTCAALIKYDENLRDIYAASLLYNGPTTTIVGTPISRQNAFNSFGFVPLMRITDDLDDFKESIMEKSFSKKALDGTPNNYILIPDHFEAWIGFYDEKNAEDIKNWEKAIAEKIGRYGILTKGNLRHFPYLSRDITDQPAGFDGLTGLEGLTARSIISTTNPQSENYIDYDSEDFPFRDIFKASGNYLNARNSNFNLTGLYVAQLDNEWGSRPEDIEFFLKRLAGNAACDNFKDTSVIYNSDIVTTPATFALEDFKPKFIKMEEAELDDIEDELGNALNANPAARALLGKIINIRKETRIGTTFGAYNESRCPKLYVMMTPRVAYPIGKNLPTYPTSVINTNPGTPKTNPHLRISFGFNRAKNNIMVNKLKAFNRKKENERIKQIPKNICDESMLDDVCNNGYPVSGVGFCSGYSNNPALARLALTNPNCKCNTPSDDFFSKLQLGFTSGFVNSFNARNIYVRFQVHPYTAPYVANSANLHPNAFGGVSATIDGEDYPIYTQYDSYINITYPLESINYDHRVIQMANPQYNPNFKPSPFGPANPNPQFVNVPVEQYNFYSGILEQQVKIQVRAPEQAQIFGEYWSGSANVMKVKQINNGIDQHISPLIDPKTKKFFSPVYDMAGNIITGAQQAHNLSKSLSNIANSQPSHALGYKIIGDAATVPVFNANLKPEKGLTKLSFSLSQDGFVSDVSFANRPPNLPKPEAILNKINPRLNKL